MNSTRDLFAPEQEDIFSPALDGEGFRVAVRRFDGMTVGGMEQKLLSAALAGLDWDCKVPMTKLVAPAAKWRVISAMQKAIRRGDAQMAVKCALAVDSYDSKYLWRRLAIVGFEDGGVTMLPLTALVCFLAGKTEWRKTLDDCGGRRVLSYIVERMALMPKDRSLCETATVGKFITTDKEKEELFVAPRPGLLKEYADPARPVGRRYMCGLALSGGLWQWGKDEKTGEVVRQYAPADKEALFAWLDSTNLPVLVKYCLRRGMSLGAEGFPIALPIVWPIFEAEYDKAEVRKMECPEVETIGMLPSYAYDIHTFEGKKAIAYFMKACKPVREWLDNNFTGDRQRFVGVALFRVEGGLVFDAYLDYLYWRRVLALIYDAEAKFYGFSPGRLMEFYRLVRANLCEVNKARKRVVLAGV